MRQKRPHYYILQGKVAVPIEGDEPSDWMRWARWFEQAAIDGTRIVAQAYYPSAPRNVCVSTVFLGLDHNWSFQGRPILFETMVFGLGDSVELVERCSTWEEAETIHSVTVKRVEGILARRRQEIRIETDVEPSG